MNSKTLLQSTNMMPLGRIQSFLQQRLVETLVFFILLNLGLAGVATWNILNISQNLKNMVNRQTNLQEISSKASIADSNFDQNLLVKPGQQLWEKRYINNTANIKIITKDLKQDIPAESQDIFQQVERSGNKLIALENRGFQFSKERNLEAAAVIMTGKEYVREKTLYVQGVQAIIISINEQIKGQIEAQRVALDRSILLVITSLGLLLAIGGIMVLAVQGYIRDQEKSRRAIQEFQDDLLQLNEQLKEEAQLRSAQQNQIVQESEALQTDVGHILDVVCSLEEGDLTVQAQVNERATGLVSDTLNRLIESLHGIITIVVSSAYQVTNRAAGLDQLAVETASQAQNQTQSIQQVESLIAQVNKLTINSRQQAIATTNVVQLAKTAVASGQEEMNAMVVGIESLQEGTEEMVKRMQVLNDFVELAAQFAKDQKRVAALTRVLALNASLLSTRAVQEQNPEQFASIANEFETIAIQVNELAIDTNRSLVTLQQRTNQIQTVTSGLDQDVIDINQLVQKFTDEVNKSRQAFRNIQSVTEQVATMGAQVSDSSEDIATVVRNTLNAIQSIGIIAQNTEDKAIIAREQVKNMSELAQKLLQKVEFFQLAEENPGVLVRSSLPDGITVKPFSESYPYQFSESPS
jgi:methyl-accepting chemotaxis protein PixJ